MKQAKPKAPKAPSVKKVVAKKTGYR
jgi:hypothetical protein